MTYWDNVNKFAYFGRIKHHFTPGLMKVCLWNIDNINTCSHQITRRVSTCRDTGKVAIDKLSDVQTNPRVINRQLRHFIRFSGEINQLSGLLGPVLVNLQYAVTLMPCLAMTPHQCTWCDRFCNHMNTTTLLVWLRLIHSTEINAIFMHVNLLAAAVWVAIFKMHCTSTLEIKSECHSIN